MSKEKEIWKDIVGYEGIYQASSFGRLKSLKFGKEKIMKSFIDKGGYSCCSFRKDNKRKDFKVHQLVAMAFLNHQPNGHTIIVDHKNNVRSDNRLENLQLISNRENLSKDKKGSSKYTGVCWSEERKKWRASITINGKHKYIGRFTNEYEAHLAYQKELKQIRE